MAVHGHGEYYLLIHLETSNINRRRKAIRMVMDLGLHIKRSDISLMKEFEPDDLEVRKRLYLSVYAWDK